MSDVTEKMAEALERSRDAFAKLRSEYVVAVRGPIDPRSGAAILQPALGGVPFGLEDEISGLLAAYREAGEGEIERDLELGELLPCPFCGPMPAAPDLWHDDVFKAWRVGCVPCGASSGAMPDRLAERHGTTSKEAAIAAWNRRARHTPPPASVVEALQSMRDAALGLYEAAEKHRLVQGLPFWDDALKAYDAAVEQTRAALASLPDGEGERAPTTYFDGWMMGLCRCGKTYGDEHDEECPLRPLQDRHLAAAQPIRDAALEEAATIVHGHRREALMVASAANAASEYDEEGRANDIAKELKTVMGSIRALKSEASS